MVVINPRYVILGLLAAGGGLLLLRAPAPTPAISVQPAMQNSPHPPAPAPKAILVFVAGAVNRPGLYTLRVGARAFQAVTMAGGLRADADPAGVDLAEPLADGEEIAAPLRGARRSSAYGIRKPARPKTRKKSAVAQAPNPIDLNAADASALAQLPGIGAQMAQRLVQFRQINGDFATLDELGDVAGMTPRRIEMVTPFLYVNR